MNQIHKPFRWAWSILVVCTLAFAMGGCEGSDGAAGPAGPAGATGPAGPAGDPGADGTDGASATLIPLESCNVCHGEDSFADATVAHELDPIEAVSNITFGTANGGADLTVTFDVDFEVDGGLVPATTYDVVQRAYFNDGGTRTDLRDFATLTNNGGGNYTITVAGAGAEFANNNRWLFRVQDDDQRQTRVYFYADFPANPGLGPVAVTAEDCAACHGPEGIPVHGSAFIASDGGEVCLTCHGSDESDDPEVVPRLGIKVHQYHSGLAINRRTGDPENITYPTYMSNCSVCHDDASGFLAAVNDMPVYGEGCLSCHGSMDNEYWDFSGGLGFHLTQPADIDCASSTCHSVTGAATSLVAVTDFHNGLNPGGDSRRGPIFDGIDVSVAEGERFNWKIDSIVDDGVDLTITWSASYDGVGVDPCNADVANGPVFFNGNTMRAYRSYAQGDDFILGQSTTTPGAPDTDTLTVDNTSCAGGFATTIIPVDAEVAERGRVVFGGKPQVISDLIEPAATVGARVPSPAYDWLVGDGEMVARRDVVDTAKCVGCHVGSLYQHGGDRVDNVDMCLMCHNAASNEQRVRVNMGVDASEAYDGKIGETYEMKTMLHRVHSANYQWDDGTYNAPYLVYRGRGIYAFAAEGVTPPNWDVTVTDGCTAEEIADGKSRVFGSSDTSGDKCEEHHLHAPTFPRSPNECTACHKDTFTVIPNQAISMASTVEVGSTTDYSDKIDDVLQGAAATACITCHYNAATKGHAYQNSWDPQAFPEGRQTIIDAAN